jgi:peptide/nickel transport system permease protein
VRTMARGLLAGWLAVAVLAPWLAPNDPGHQFDGRPYAPPTRVHLVTASGAPAAPFFYAQHLENPLERRYADDVARLVRLRWMADGRLVFSPDPGEPLLLLGADSLGRDLFSRLLYGARISLALALVAALGATLLGAVAGVIAGFAGGLVDGVITHIAEIVLALPALYVLLALRSALPLLVPPTWTFGITAAIFALVGWPFAARGVRAIVAAERRREYVQAAVALGASRRRLLLRHLLPATGGFLRTQFALLLPACILAEATLSFAGVGFSDDLPSWGTLLQEAANISVLASAPWLLAPAMAIFSVVLAVNIAADAAAGPVPAISCCASGTADRAASRTRSLSSSSSNGASLLDPRTTTPARRVRP